MRNLTEEHGFTIVEMMVAVAILLGGALATLSMLDTATHRTRSAADRQKATALAREVVEATKAVPYRQVSPATIVQRLREDESIAGSSGSPWRVERGGTVLTVSTEVCWLDEPADKLGSHAAGGFCAGSEAGGTEDTNPIDFKRVTVSVSWENGSGRGSVKQSTLVTTRGGSDAPAIQSVRLTSPLNPLITSSGLQSASFALSTVTNAAAVVWSVDGSQQGTATGSGRNWIFSWRLPPQDGTYDVAAQTIEPSGLLGEPRSVTVVLNRFLPGAPADFVAGRNGGIVEAQWTANRDRDVVGYRVYRQSGGTSSVACAATIKTSCVDAAAPAQTSAVLDYWVVAIERVGTVEREGTALARVDVNGANRPPHTPQALTLSKDAQGNTILRWQPPTAGDTDAGDFIETYRVYRDGTEIGNRHATVGGAETSWTDTQTGGAAHRYWVASVDTHLAESTLLGPVSG